MRLLPALLLWAPVLAAQTDVTDPDPERAWKAVQERLQEAPSTERRAGIYRIFLEAHSDRPGHPRVLAGRCLLANLHLEQRRADEARTQFEKVLADGEGGGPDTVDLRGRASYGLGQALVLLEKREEALEQLAECTRHYAGTRYARAAEVLRRAVGTPAPAVGDEVPPAGLGRSLRGRKLRTGELRGQPWLLVFFSPTHEPSVRRLERLARAWSAHQPRRHLVAVALGDRETCAPLARERNWHFTVTVAEEGFLHEAAVAFGITSVPRPFLIGPRNQLLATDLSPAALTRLLRRNP